MPSGLALVVSVPRQEQGSLIRYKIGGFRLHRRVDEIVMLRDLSAREVIRRRSKVSERAKRMQVYMAPDSVWMNV